MIHHTQVRIGNLVEFEGKICEIHIVAKEFPDLNTTEFGVWDFSWEKINPIPLTGDWDKICDKKDESGDSFMYFIESLDLRMYLKNGHVLICEGATCPIAEYEHIDSLHHLQNLMFSLTGKELEYSLK